MRFDTMRAMRTRIAALCLLSSLIVAMSSNAPFAAGQDRVRAGEFLVDPPTLINLGFEWFIDGDDNRNASVEISYRKKGDTAWKRAQPCCGCRESESSTARQLDVISPNMFAGSILDLEPDTAYEAEFVLSDPDGADGHDEDDRHREDASRADARRGRPHIPRLPARIPGTEDSSRPSKDSCAPTT